MTATPFPFDPMKAYATAASATLETNMAMQNAMIKWMESAAEVMDSADFAGLFEWGAEPSAPMNLEDRMRENFHQLANMNLRNWEHAANMLSAMPDWMRWSSKAPGSFMTDWFDRVQRAGHDVGAPANDDTAAATPKRAAAKPRADDLTAIKGIGPKLSKTLNRLGVTRFEQIAAWSKDDVANYEDKLDFKGRATREKWVQQARKLAKAEA